MRFFFETGHHISIQNTELGEISDKWSKSYLIL